MRLPQPRGPMSATLAHHLRWGVPLPESAALAVAGAAAGVADPLGDADLQLALALCYELHYRGFDGVDDAWEWEPALLAVRRALEQPFERALRDAVAPVVPAAAGEDVPAALTRLIAADDGPSLSSYLVRSATLGQYRHFVVQRSVYQLREADPHTWGIPRLSGRAKAALVEIQADEYGGGRVERMHSTLFARTMRALELDDTYGAYWDHASAETLTTVNLMSMFGLHRRWRGALLGHLAVLEMTSSTPNRRYANGLRRLGLGPEATEFYDEHVEADAVHEQLAAVDMCGSFVAAEPQRRADVLFGAACCLHVEARFATALLQGWAAEPAA
jgi:Iron-containing redox enzyme